jgi:hypothetical protein
MRLHVKWLTFSVRAVRPAEFSELNLPDWGPGFGFFPARSSSSILMVLSGVKSSYNHLLSQKPMGLHKTTNIKVIIDLYHRRVTASAKTFYLNHREFLIGGRVSKLNPQMLSYRFDD